MRVLVHPECRQEVVAKADEVGRTERIIRRVEASPPGSSWAVGTQLNLVHRLATQHPDKTIAFLDRTVCFCSTVNRIDLPTSPGRWRRVLSAIRMWLAGAPQRGITLELHGDALE